MSPPPPAEYFPMTPPQDSSPDPSSSSSSRQALPRSSLGNNNQHQPPSFIVETPLSPPDEYDPDNDEQHHQQPPHQLRPEPISASTRASSSTSNSNSGSANNHSYPNSSNSHYNSYDDRQQELPRQSEDTQDGFFMGEGVAGGGGNDQVQMTEFGRPSMGGGGERPDRQQQYSSQTRSSSPFNPFAQELQRPYPVPNHNTQTYHSQASSWYAMQDPFASPTGSSFKSSLRNPVPSLRGAQSSTSLSALAQNELQGGRGSGEINGLGIRGLGVDEMGRGTPSFRSSSSNLLAGGVSKHALMAEHLYRKGISLGWFPDAAFGIVVVRSTLGSYVTFPPAEQVEGVEELLVGVKGLNCEVAVVLTSNVVRSVVDTIPLDKEEVPLKGASLQIQVLEDLGELSMARRNQQGAFIRSDRSMVVWSDDVKGLVPQVASLTDSMVSFVWDFSTEKGDPWMMENQAITTETERRKVQQQAPVMIGLAVGLNIVICCLTIRTLLNEYFTDSAAMRLVILVSVPFEFCVLQFFTSSIFTVVFQILAPVKQVQENSRYYSGAKPPTMTGKLPHFTVQMPVYKESLEGVLKPTIQSIQAAMRTYELQGGSASLLISDDGMQLLNSEDLMIRKDYYDLNSIAYVARPGHCAGYPRAGRFKKASNLNFTLELSQRVENLMNERRPAVTESSSPWLAEHEESLYQSCISDALLETQRTVTIKEFQGEDEPEPEMFEDGVEGKKLTKRDVKKRDKERTKRREARMVEKEKVVGGWSAGSIRMGELILIVDSDTRVPDDCFLDAASEMHFSPDVAILQHQSDVMFAYMGANFFENGIAFFTRMVNLSISWVCSSGDIAPFVGHNAFLRWSALQEVATEEAEGRRQIWSESHVSEDFDMALRLLKLGYVVRWCSYANTGTTGGFEEGVSLSADDEVNRWQKYAFGVGELIFNPFSQWWRRGPFTRQICDFLIRSNLPIHYKFSSWSYMMSYFAIAIAWCLSIFNYVIYGLFIPTLDQAYVSAFKITLGLLVVFSLAGSISFAFLRFRSGDCGFFRAFYEQFMWLPFFIIFFGGLSFHVSMALISHLVGYNMIWSATQKDATTSTVFKELPNIAKRFWVMETIMWICLIGTVILATPLVPMEWTIIDWVAIWPFCMVIVPHIIFPLFLNPYIIQFRF